MSFSEELARNEIDYKLSRSRQGQNDLALVASDQEAPCRPEGRMLRLGLGLSRGLILGFGAYRGWQLGSRNDGLPCYYIVDELLAVLA